MKTLVSILALAFLWTTNINAQTKEQVLDYIQNGITILGNKDVDAWMKIYPNDKELKEILKVSERAKNEDEYVKDFLDLEIEVELMKAKRKFLQSYLHHFPTKKTEVATKFADWKNMKVKDVNFHISEKENTQSYKVQKMSGRILMEHQTSKQYYIAHFTDIIIINNVMYGLAIEDEYISEEKTLHTYKDNIYEDVGIAEEPITYDSTFYKFVEGNKQIDLRIITNKKNPEYIYQVAFAYIKPGRFIELENINTYSENHFVFKNDDVTLLLEKKGKMLRGSFINNRTNEMSMIILKESK